jgi:hypothetical protein
MTDYRASFDAAITFSNGGDLTAHGFRVDAPSPDIDENGIAALFVASLGLLMTDSVTLANVEIFAEPRKGTRGGPSDHGGGRPPAGRRQPERVSAGLTSARSAVVSRLEEFKPVAVRVLAVEAAHPGEVVVEEGRSAGGAKPARPGVQVADQ